MRARNDGAGTSPYLGPGNDTKSATETGIAHTGRGSGWLVVALSKQGWIEVRIPSDGVMGALQYIWRGLKG